MIQLNAEINDAATNIAHKIVNDEIKNVLSYPPSPDDLLSENEIEALKEIQKIPFAEVALKKIIAEGVATAFFGLLNSIDGTDDPKKEFGEWKGVALIDRSFVDGDPYDFMLHDAMFEMYWEWKNLKEKNGE